MHTPANDLTSNSTVDLRLGVLGFGTHCKRGHLTKLNNDQVKDYAYFLKRSENWRNVYDSQSTFMRPKLKNGEFVNEFIPKEYSSTPATNICASPIPS